MRNDKQKQKEENVSSQIVPVMFSCAISEVNIADILQN